jgi:uncharacterized protein (DUF1697 family)
MPRYVAFLRGVSPQNLSMALLRECLTTTGYTDVRTILSSGNVAFTTKATAVATLERRMTTEIAGAAGRTFPLTIRSSEFLAQLIASDPFAAFAAPTGAKRVVTFLQQPVSPVPRLPITGDGVQILAMIDREIFTTYVAHPKGPVFMSMLERTFGRDITTRTWDTVARCATA